MKKIFSLFLFGVVLVCLTACEDSGLHPKEAVDLGLSVQWATCNIGASSPEDAGDYFAWGEVKPKDNYDWSSNGDYKWGVFNEYDSPNYGMTKYNKKDGKTVLASAHDAASIKWGDGWRMPTLAEQEELINNCTWTWKTVKGVSGYKVEGRNGNSIFLPAVGYRDGKSIDFMGDGYYWSSTVDNVEPYWAWYLDFNTNNKGCYSNFRCVGLPIRPVRN